MSAGSLNGGVITKLIVERETARRLRLHNLQTGEELRRMRQDAGVSLRGLSAVTGLHPSFLARIEAGKVQASVPTLMRIGVALGADLSVRFFPGSGPRLRDRFQAPMIEGLLRAVHQRWSAEVEVGIRRPTRGVVDVLLHDRLSPTTVVGEALSGFHRLEAEVRWFGAKADAITDRLREEGAADRHVSRLLILRSTVSTRAIAREFEATLTAAYPARSCDIFDALTGPGAWPGSGIIWVRSTTTSAALLRFPPRGVRLGR
jgi:transcriptional regulator with XRE-family HTH domain